MRPSTRTSRRLPRLPVRAFLSLVVLLPLLAAEASALSVLAEGRVRAERGSAAVSQRSALAVALARAVEIVVQRHVAASELAARAAEVRSAFLSRPSPYIQRYAISSEGAEGDEFTVSVEVEVSQEKVLARLQEMGFGVHRLPARPRVLLAALGGAASTAVSQGMARVLAAQGFAVRTMPGEGAESVDGGTAAQWARGLGCHVAFLAAAEDGAPAPEEGGGAALARQRARGWIVGAREGLLLGQAEVVGSGGGEDAVAAGARAAVRAGERLVTELLARLEQSGWRPGEVVEVADLEVQGLPSAALVEALQGALPGVTEVRGATLREVGPRTALWRLELLDSGLGPEAVLAALGLPQGRLEWVETVPAADRAPMVVRARWAPR